MKCHVFQVLSSVAGGETLRWQHCMKSLRITKVWWHIGNMGFCRVAAWADTQQKKEGGQSPTVTGSVAATSGFNSAGQPWCRPVPAALNLFVSILSGFCIVHLHAKLIMSCCCVGSEWLGTLSFAAEKFSYTEIVEEGEGGALKQGIHLIVHN